MPPAAKGQSKKILSKGNSRKFAEGASQRKTNWEATAPDGRHHKNEHNCTPQRSLFLQFLFICEVLVRFQTPRTRLSGRDVWKPTLTHVHSPLHHNTLFSPRSNIFSVKSVCLLKSFSTRIESFFGMSVLKDSCASSCTSS